MASPRRSGPSYPWRCRSAAAVCPLSTLRQIRLLRETTEPLPRAERKQTHAMLCSLSMVVDVSNDDTVNCSSLSGSFPLILKIPGAGI